MMKEDDKKPKPPVAKDSPVITPKPTQIKPKDQAKDKKDQDDQAIENQNVLRRPTWHV